MVSRVTSSVMELSEQEKLRPAYRPSLFFPVKNGSPRSTKILSNTSNGSNKIKI